MKNYNVIYAFLDKDKYIEVDEEGMPKYHNTVVQAYNKGEALDKLVEIEKFNQMPEIIDVVEVKDDSIRSL